MTNADVALLARRILDTHHALLHAELPRLDAALVGQSRQVRAPFAHLRRVMDEHMMKEENILFPAILALAERGESSGCGVEGPILQMLAEHDEIRTLEWALREASRDAGVHEAALLAMLDDLSEHARTEDEELFPAALALMAPEGQVRAEELRRGEASRPSQTRPSSPDSARSPRRIVPAEPEVPAQARVVRNTRGTCSVCAVEVPAAVVILDGKALLQKTCPEHGVTTQLLSQKAQWWADLDRFYFDVNDEAYAQRDYIVRMTERCNLDCPICLAKANTEDTPDLDLSGLERLIATRRGIKIDLMAAEPTLREDLEDWVRRVKASGNIAALHTNGLKLANLEYAQRMKAAGVDEVFLQFDGLDEQANKALRGRRLLKARMAALKNLRKVGIATSLIVVIARGLNEKQVSETFHFALRPENDHIREVFFLGLRMLGSARHTEDSAPLGRAQAMMPDELIDLLTEQVPAIKRKDVHAFNMLYFAMLSAFKVKKCLYVQHYLVARQGEGGFIPAADFVDLKALSGAAQRYADSRKAHPTLARVRLAAEVVRQGVISSPARHMALDLAKLETLFATGMNLSQVPPRFLLIGFITACDPDNFDSMVAQNCGKGELSVDGGFTDSSARANVRRERRFAETDRDPGPPTR